MIKPDYWSVAIYLHFKVPLNMFSLFTQLVFYMFRVYVCLYLFYIFKSIEYVIAVFRMTPYICEYICMRVCWYLVYIFKSPVDVLDVFTMMFVCMYEIKTMTSKMGFWLNIRLGKLYRRHILCWYHKHISQERDLIY